MPNPETGRFQELLGRLGGDLDSFVNERRPDPVTTAESWCDVLGGPVPEQGAGIDGVLQMLEDAVLPAGSRISDPGFWGFITAGPSTAPVTAATAAMVASPQRYTVTSFNFLEEHSLDWLVDLFGLAPEMKGLYSSGGSTANLVALGGARQAAYEAIGVDISASGYADRPGAMYTSTEAHHTVQRSAGVLGIGRSMVRAIPVDERQRMDTAALRDALAADARDGILPVAVVATAGTTNTGAIDPLREVGELAAEFGTWFHVDGAYGLPGIVDDRVAERFDGLELADSVIVDPHKWLGAPVGIAATFVRDRGILHRAFTQEPAAYLEGSFAEGDVQMSVDSMGIPYGDMGVELSAPARGIMVWAIVVEQGREGLIKRIKGDNDRARLLTDLANDHPRLEALTDPDLSIACVRYVGDGEGDLSALNQALLRRLLRETEFMPSSTLVNSEFVIRPCFMNVRTGPDQVEAFAQTLVELGDDLSGINGR
jgi:aromatic-L-amino-acid decarboxylase